LPAKITGNNNGTALLVTVMMIALLAAVLFEVNRRVRVSIDEAALFKNSIKLASMADSGVHIGMAVLINDKDETEIDSIQEPWADAEHLKSVAAGFPFEDGEISITITDLLGRIQVNALVQYPEGKQFNETQKVMWYQLLQMVSMGKEMDGKETEAEVKPISIINSVKDWLDYGDDDAITGLDGAESDYYQSLDYPHGCRNGPVVDVSELVLVKGLSPEIFQAIEALYGVSSWVTTFGMMEVAQGEGFTFPGAININSAPLFVLTAMLPLEDNYLAMDIYEFRQEMTNGNYVNDLSGAAWYKNVHGCSELTLNADLITTQSDFFQIRSTAVLDGTSVVATAVVKREKDEKSGKWRCRVLKWQS